MWKIRLGALALLALTAGRNPVPAQVPTSQSAAVQGAKKEGLIYQPSLGSFWDPTVIYANGQYYMYTMYGGDGVWLATSTDGVHWKDYGVVLKSEGFKNNRVWKQYVNKVGDKFIMNHGAFTDDAVVLLCESHRTNWIHLAGKRSQAFKLKVLFDELLDRNLIIQH